MRAERLGSYSTDATTAGMPCLSRLKSMTRYAFLWPPPMNRAEIRPVLVRPPVRCLGCTRDFSGVCFVISSRVTVEVKRRAGVTGVYFLIGILNLREVGHLLALLQPHVGLFPIGTIAGETAAAAQLAFERRRADFRDFHLKKLFDGGFHRGLGGFLRHLEAQRALFVFLGHALFGDAGAEEYGMDVHVASASENLRAAASLRKTLLWPSRW